MPASTHRCNIASNLKAWLGLRVVVLAWGCAQSIAMVYGAV